MNKNIKNVLVFTGLLIIFLITSSSHFLYRMIGRDNLYNQDPRLIIIYIILSILSSIIAIIICINWVRKHKEMSHSNYINTNFGIKTDEEVKNFASEKDAVKYLKETGMPDKQIEELIHSGNKSTVRQVSKKTYIKFGN